MRYVFLVVSGLMLSPLAASAADLPPAVRQVLTQSATLCRDAGGVPAKFEAAATEIDINGDGVTDWVVDLSKVTCERVPNNFCGLAGCQIYVMIAQGTTHIHAWGDAVYAWRQVRVGGQPGIQVDMHDSGCKGVAPCTKSLVFDGSRMREVK